MCVHSESCEGRWLNNDEAHVVLAQIACLGPEAIKATASRTAAMSMLSELLSGGRRLAEIVTQGRPAILILPELALSFSDWGTVDELVRGYPSPLILISGFTFTPGADLQNWLAGQPSTTERRAAWDANAAPAAGRLYNGGWCWVHRPGVHTRCIAFQKVTAEQREEIRIDSLDTGQNTFCLELDDLIIFPVICSDFLSVVSGQRLIANRISQHITTHYHNDQRKILVAGLLCQHKSHPNWRTAISDIARLINIDKVNVCLINWAYDILLTQEDDDRWRDYSGIYVARERRPSSYQMNPVRRFSTDNIEGVVTRTTSACVVGGPVRWSFNEAARHIWAVNQSYTLAADGTLSGPCCEDSVKYELLRFLRRLTEASDVVIDSIKPCISDGLRAIKGHLDSGSPPTSSGLIRTTLFGETTTSDNVEADGIPQYARELSEAFKALGGLSLVTQLRWQQNPTIRGQFHCDDGTGILVWSSPDMFVRIKQKIAKWRSEALRISPLIIFYKASGQTPHGQAMRDRRDDISAAPAPEKRSAAEPAQPNVVLEVSLDELSQHLHEDTTAAAVGGLSLLVREKLASINSQEAH